MHIHLTQKPEDTYKNIKGQLYNWDRITINRFSDTECRIGGFSRTFADIFNRHLYFKIIFPALLRYNWHKKLCKFKVYSFDLICLYSTK